MTAEELLAGDFAALPDLIRAHARERAGPSRAHRGRRDAKLRRSRRADGPRSPSLFSATASRGGGAVAICARNLDPLRGGLLGILAAGAAVALLAPSSTPASLVMMLKDSGAKVFLLDRETAEALKGTGYEKGMCSRVALDDSDAATPFSRWLGPEGATPANVVDRARSAVQHHLFVRHDRRAQRHRSAASHAMAPVPHGSPTGAR